MGGHAGGEFASAIAVNTVEEVFAATSDAEEEMGGQTASTERTQTTLQYAVRMAGQRIYEKAIEEPEYKGMGTTCVAMVVAHGAVHIGHVGDSRAYLVQSDSVRQLTDDHSLVNEKVKAGLITPEQARTHRLKNIITRSLGFQEDVEVDIIVEPVGIGDRLMMCSDGLSNLVTDQELANIIRTNSTEESASALIQLACERGGDDNITVIIVEVDEV